MLKHKKNIDAVFKDGLGDYSITPPSYVWDSINTSLNNQKKQSRSLFFWRSVAAACVAILIVVAMQILHDSSLSTVDDSFQAASTKADMKPTLRHDKMVIKEEHSSAKDKLPLVKDVVVPIDKSNNSVQTMHAGKFEPKRQTAFLTAKKDVNLIEYYKISNTLHSNKAKVYYPLYAADIAAASNRKKTSIQIGGLLSPVYNSKVSSGSQVNTVKANEVEMNESGVNSLGGGFQMRINRGSRWSFETGVLYTQIGQQVSNSVSQDYILPKSDALAAPMPTYNHMQLSNSMGNIIVERPVGSDFSYSESNQFVENGINNSGVSLSDGLKQTLEYLEIPMMARYALFKNFPYLSLAGGFSSNILVGNTAYAIDNDTQHGIGETEDIKPFVLSSSLGLGVDVPLGKMLHFSLEPRVKYFLNSVSSNSGFDFQPYSFGVYGGITFVIK